MFQSLTEKLNHAFSFFRNKGKVSEADVKAGMREIKLALLEALKPFLAEKRRDKLDRAMKLARMEKMAELAFGALGGEKHE